MTTANKAAIVIIIIRLLVIRILLHDNIDRKPLP